jgi:tRNA-Thr(GGU) m(6)t(6)A37 methyltransferase TsaA
MNDEPYHQQPLILTPVGEVHSTIKTPILLAGKSGIELQERMGIIRQYHETVQKTVSEVIIFPRWQELLDGIDGFSHVLLLYWPHLIDPERRNLTKVHPMGRKDLPRQGIFATCSPARPNPVLVSAVPLVERTENGIKVQGLEAVDGSPVIDLKPYVHLSHGADKSTIPEWMKQIHKDLGIDYLNNRDNQP